MSSNQESHLSLIPTEDGSNTIFNKMVGEAYHSKNGALQESLHVFIGEGLKHFLNVHSVSEIAVFEMGFGTGLNFLLTADYCLKHNIHLHYTAIEAFPLSREMFVSTGYDLFIEDKKLYESFLQHYEEKSFSFQHDLIRFELVVEQMEEFKTLERYDIIFFDAFAPVHQPELWKEEIITSVCLLLKPSGIFVTYSMTGNLKRILKKLNFVVEKPPGAKGKREMCRGINLRQEQL